MEPKDWGGWVTGLPEDRNTAYVNVTTAEVFQQLLTGSSDLMKNQRVRLVWEFDADTRLWVIDERITQNSEGPENEIMHLELNEEESTKLNLLHKTMAEVHIVLWTAIQRKLIEQVDENRTNPKGRVLKLKAGTACSPFQNSVALEDGDEFKENKLKGGINARRHGDEIQEEVDYNESIKLAKSEIVNNLIQDQTLPEVEGDAGTSIRLGRCAVNKVMHEYNRQAGLTSKGQGRLEYQHFVKTTEGDVPEAAEQWKQIIGKYCQADPNLLKAKKSKQTLTGSAGEIQAKKPRPEYERAIDPPQKWALVMPVSVKGTETVDNIAREYVGDEAFEEIHKLKLDLGEVGTAVVNGVQVYFICVYAKDTTISDRNTWISLATKTVGSDTPPKRKS
jgi:hypothetical protein